MLPTGRWARLAVVVANTFFGTPLPPGNPRIVVRGRLTRSKAHPYKVSKFTRFAGLEIRSRLGYELLKFP